MSQRQSTINSFTAKRVPNIALLFPSHPLGQVNVEVGCPVPSEASRPIRQRASPSVRGEHRAFADDECRQQERPAEVPREGRHWQRQDRASHHCPYGSVQELDCRQKAIGMKSPSMREGHHDILAKGQVRLAPESAYPVEFNAVTESMRTAMRQYMPGQAAAPKAPAPAPSS